VVEKMKETRNLTKVPFTGLGLVFGTAIGAGLSLAITGNVLWAGIGTGIGLILGAAADSFVKNKQKKEDSEI
jgi:hypothetical protein